MDARASSAGPTDAFARLVETLTSDYDVLELLHSLVLECVELIAVDAAAIVLMTPEGGLELVASTSEGADFVEVMQLNAGDGPCVESFRSGSIISVPDVAATGGDWAPFRSAAQLQGFASAYSVPLRLRAAAVGAIGLFRRERGELSGADSAIAQALADFATLAIVQEPAPVAGGPPTEQLQRALEARGAVREAMRLLAGSAQVEEDEAFRRLRRHARQHSLHLRLVAERVVGGSLDLGGGEGDEPSR